MRKNYKKWNEGTPPAIGWYPASGAKTGGIYRWWDGKHWSSMVTISTPFEFVNEIASKKQYCFIYWKHQPKNWPKNARTY